MTNDSTGLSATAPTSRWPRSAWRGRPLPVHPVLVAAYPVLFLYGQNMIIVNGQELYVDGGRTVV